MEVAPGMGGGADCRERLMFFLLRENIFFLLHPPQYHGPQDASGIPLGRAHFFVQTGPYVPFAGFRVDGRVALALMFVAPPFMPRSHY